MKFLRDLIIEAFFAIWERGSKLLERWLDEGRLIEQNKQADTEEKQRAFIRDADRHSRK